MALNEVDKRKAWLEWRGSGDENERNAGLFSTPDKLDDPVIIRHDFPVLLCLVVPQPEFHLGKFTGMGLISGCFQSVARLISLSG